MKSSEIIVFLILLSIISQKTFSQNKLQSTLDNYMVSLREPQKTQATPEILYKNNQPELILEELHNYYNDTLPKVRSKAYYLTYRIGKENSRVTGRAIEMLCGGLKDKNSGIVGTVMDYLKEFHSNKFTQQAKDTISILVNRGTPHYKKIIKIAGFLNLENTKHLFRRKLQMRDYNSSGERWAILLALSRMGDQDAIDFCLKIAKKMETGDDFVYEIAPGFVYTREKKLIDYLISLLYSNEKNCYSSNPESNKKIHCGYRIMEYLAPITKDFPLQADIAGEIKTDDYKKALEITRKWFDTHKKDYKLNTHTF